MPATSEKQRRFMGAELARKRSGKKTQTGMSESQLSDFAHGSLEDIAFHEQACDDCGDVICDTFTHPLHKGYGYKGEKTGLNSEGAITWGAMDPPKIDGEDAEPFEDGKQSCNRDAGQGLHYGAPIDYFGPDTNYRAEEIDPHQYGKDYEPFPLRDYHKTEDEQWERNFRLEEQDQYDSTRTPGTVSESNPMVEAYGARSYRDVEKARDVPDRRAFDSQREYARTNKKKSQEYAVDITGLDTKKGSKIR
jgi:hypothetical protein